jgi:glycosyltransferase involved in cell wall biosynthesis
MEIITFIVPAFNSQKTISRTINSILCQTVSNYQIILINDGSTDNTSNICENYQKEYPEKIKYIKQENKGLGGARNTGLKVACSEYISFLDSDDWLMPNYVETLIKYIGNDKQKKPEIILTLPKIYDENSKLVYDWYDVALFNKIFEKDGQIKNPQKEIRLLWTDVNQCRKVLYLKFIQKINFSFRENVKWEDVYPHFYLMSQCQLCMGIGSVGFYYRKGNSSQITSSRGYEWLDLLIVYRDLIKYLKDAISLLPSDVVNAMYNPATRIMTSLALEGIHMSDVSTRKKLVKELSFFFRKLPKEYTSNFNKFIKATGTKTEIRNFKLFLSIIKNDKISHFYDDYFYQEMLEVIIKKFIRYDKKRNWR